MFEKLFSSYSQAFKDHYAKLSRKEQTAIVNNGITMVDGRYQSQVMEKYTMEEALKKEKEKEHSVGAGGVIREVAEVCLGLYLRRC